MRPQTLSLLMGGILLLLPSSAARAGMPAPPPANPEQIFRLNETAQLRLQAISFFLPGFLLCAAAVRWLWNYLQRDFPQLPRLSYPKALAGVLLWGLLFIIVLTMISGARELMTPGAWRKQGFTYRLASQVQTAEASPVDRRRQQLERLRTALWQFAATHGGRFPSLAEVADLPADLWEIPETGGLRYLYFPGLSANQAPDLLAFEPELDPRQRLVLQTDGNIVTRRSEEIRPPSPKEGSP
jgi:hypothetical protein